MLLFLQFFLDVISLKIDNSIFQPEYGKYEKNFPTNSITRYITEKNSIWS